MVETTNFDDFVCRKSGFLDFTGYFTSKRLQIKPRHKDLTKSPFKVKNDYKKKDSDNKDKIKIVHKEQDSIISDIIETEETNEDDYNIYQKPSNDNLHIIPSHKSSDNFSFNNSLLELKKLNSMNSSNNDNKLLTNPISNKKDSKFKTSSNFFSGQFSNEFNLKELLDRKNSNKNTQTNQNIIIRNDNKEDDSNKDLISINNLNNSNSTSIKKTNINYKGFKQSNSILSKLNSLASVENSNNNNNFNNNNNSSFYNLNLANKLSSKFLDSFLVERVDQLTNCNKVDNNFKEVWFQLTRKNKLMQEFKYKDDEIFDLNNLNTANRSVRRSKSIMFPISVVEVNNDEETDDELNSSISKNHNIITKNYFKKYSTVKNNYAYYKNKASSNGSIEIDFSNLNKVSLFRNHLNNNNLRDKELVEKENRITSKYFENNWPTREDEDYVYYSDNEDNIKEAEKHNNYNYSNKIELFTGMLEDYIQLKKRTITIYHKRHLLKKRNIIIPNDKTIKPIITNNNSNNANKVEITKSKNPLISMFDRYNKQRKNKLKLKSKNKSIKNEVETKISKFMFNWLMNLKVLKHKEKDFIKKSKTKVTLDENAFNNIDVKKSPNNPIERNKNQVRNIYFQLHNGVEKYFPDLMSLNIAKYQEEYPLLNRKMFYEIFCQYKIILKMCVALNRSMALVKEGIDISSFASTLPEVWGESQHFSQALFSLFDKSKNGYISLDEFISTMLKLKSKNMGDKIDIFLKIIDSDGNGKLSFEEVYDLSIHSLNRFLSKDDHNIKEILARAFTNMIFNFCDVDVNDEISMPLIKEKILLGGEEAEYLEMFCGAS